MLAALEPLSLGAAAASTDGRAPNGVAGNDSAP